MKKLTFSLLLVLCCVNNVHSQSGWVWMNPLPQGESLTTVKMINDSIIYAAGWKGTIIKSIDGGNNWIVQKRGNHYDYWGSYWLNEYTGIIVGIGEYSLGYKGIISKTTNGGTNWTDIQISNNISGLTSIYFVNSSTGYAV